MAMTREQKRAYDQRHARRVKELEEELELKIAELKARRDDEVKRNNVLTRGREGSVDLLLANYDRGMSMQRLINIWGRQFVNAALLTRTGG